MGGELNMPQAIDITGERYGRLIAIRRLDRRRNGHTVWLCKCDCGNETEVVIGSLRNGLTRSCGCLNAERRIEHGMTHTRLYGVWLGMRRRCDYKKHRDYPNYGGRGIKVCPQWRDSFSSFYEWAIANGYDETAPYMACTLDRIDPDGDYEPSNCRWVDAKTQANNRRKKGAR